MDYKKKLMEYRKSIGATKTSDIMRTVTFRDSGLNLDEPVNQLNFSQLNLRPQHRTVLSDEEDDNIGENRPSATKEYRKSIGVSRAPPSTRIVSFRESALNIDEPSSQQNLSKLNLRPQHRTLLNDEEDDCFGRTKRSATGEYSKYVGVSSTSPITRTVPLGSSVSNLENPGNQNNSSQLNLQPQQRQHRRNLFNVEGDDFVSENRQSAIRELSHLRVSSLSPSPQPNSHQTVLPTPGYLRESSFLFEPIGRYVNWNSHHAFLASQPWCCIGDLKAFCDKYEFKAISVSDVQAHANIVSEIRSLLSGKAPFDMRRRFPGNIRNTENLFVCIGRCPNIEYHLGRILTAFRRPLNKLSTEKQNTAKQNFHLAVGELHLDISARISEIKLYCRNVFEKEFHLKWQDNLD